MSGAHLSRALFVAIFIATLIGSPHASRAQNAAGITVTPVVDTFNIEPAQTVTRTVRVINPVARSLTLYPRVLDFHTDNENGQPQFYNVKEKKSPYAMSTWATFSKPFLRIEPNEEEKFDVLITAPTDADPGGHYAAILFSTEEPKLDEDVSQIGVIGLVGTLLLATVPGAVDERLLLQEFTAPRFLISPPANFTTLFSNLGNVHIAPKGEIKIRNWSGDTVKTLAMNEGGGNVLPDSKRRFENKWDFDWKTVGKYTATAVAYYGTPEQQLTAMRAFYVIPLWLIITVIALVLILAAWIVRRRKKKAPVVLTNTLPTPPTPKPPKYVMR
jgi:hypothetical protein